MKRLHTHSQHFLRSPMLVQELIGHSNIRKNDLVYDLGAGSGVISTALARRCRHVIAVEVETGAVQKLRENTEGYDNITIVESDILALDTPSEPYKIFANIPFSLSAPIVRKFTENSLKPKSVYIIVQKQFARKLVPGSDHFTSQLSAEIGPWFLVRIRKPLRKTDFTPPPAVDTVLLELKLREVPLVANDKQVAYCDFIVNSFSRQKYFTGLDRSKAGISVEIIPSQLTLEQWVELFNTQVAS